MVKLIIYEVWILFIVIVGFVSCCVGVGLVSAVPDMEWSQIYGGDNTDAGNYVAVADDGGYIITGETNSFGAVGTDA